jgi:hypothetical protein
VLLLLNHAVFMFNIDTDTQVRMLNAAAVKAEEAEVHALLLP